VPRVAAGASHIRRDHPEQTCAAGTGHSVCVCKIEKERGTNADQKVIIIIIQFTAFLYLKNSNKFSFSKYIRWIKKYKHGTT